ncbi:MAG: hypothetical protein ABIO79_15595 [Ferruginibacter sp.]
MAKAVKKAAAANAEIISKIYFIRNKKIMLDRDLAELSPPWSVSHRPDP